MRLCLVVFPIHRYLEIGDEYTVRQSENLGGKKLKYDLAEVDEKKKREECKTRWSSHNLGLRLVANKKLIKKAQALRDSSMTPYMVSERPMEINTKHSIMPWLMKVASEDKSDKSVNI